MNIYFRPTTSNLAAGPRPGVRPTLVATLLCLFIFAIPAELPRLYRDVSVTLVVGGVSVAFGVLDIIWRGRARIPPAGYLFLVMFVAWATASLSWTSYPEEGLSKVEKYWQMLFITGLMTQYASLTWVRLRLFSFYIAGCWYGLVGLAANAVSGLEYEQQLSRYSSPGTDPNFLALALVIGVPIACYKGINEVRAWKRLLFLSYVPAAIAGLILTGSRGGAVALLGAAVTFGLCSGRRGRLTLSLGVLVSLAMVTVLPPHIVSRFTTIPEELRHGTLGDRRMIWDSATALVKEHPFRGLGAGAGEAALPLVTHNVVLGLALEGGVVSVMLFYGVLLCSLPRVWGHAPAERMLLVTLCAAWLVGTCSLSWESHKVTWFVFGLLVSAVSARAHAPSGQPYREGKLGYILIPETGCLRR